MSPLTQSVALHRDPLGVLRRCRARHGRVFTLRLAGMGPVVVVADPASVPLVLADERAGSARRRLLPFASPRSALGADGDEHRAARAQVAELFTPPALARHLPGLAEGAERHVRSWPRQRPFRLLPVLKRLIDDVYVEHVLGIADPRRRSAVVSGIGRMLWTPGKPPLALPGQGDGARDAYGRALFGRQSAPLRRALRDEIAARRSRPATVAAGHDLLQALGASDPGHDPDEILDRLLPLLMAGQEPPAIALTWLCLQLGRDRAQADRFAEAPRDDAWRRGVVSETLRLWPPASGALRRLTDACAVNGAILPAGALVHAPMALLQRDRRLYPEPDAFRPDRWKAGTPIPGAFFPFGHGARRCLGEPLAHAYFDAVAPAILRRVRLKPAWPRGERMVARATTLMPHRCGLVIAADR